MGNSTGNTDKKFITTSKNYNTEEKCWNMLGWKEKATQLVKQPIKLEEINLKVLAKKGRLKRYWVRI